MTPDLSNCYKHQVKNRFSIKVYFNTCRQRQYYTQQSCTYFSDEIKSCLHFERCTTETGNDSEGSRFLAYFIGFHASFCSKLMKKNEKMLIEIEKVLTEN